MCFRRKMRAASFVVFPIVRMRGKTLLTTRIDTPLKAKTELF